MNWIEVSLRLNRSYWLCQHQQIGWWSWKRCLFRSGLYCACLQSIEGKLNKPIIMLEFNSTELRQMFVSVKRANAKTSDIWRHFVPLNSYPVFSSCKGLTLLKWKVLNDKFFLAARSARGKVRHPRSQGQHHRRLHLDFIWNWAWGRGWGVEGFEEEVGYVTFFSEWNCMNPMTMTLFIPLAGCSILQEAQFLEL